MEQYNGSQIVVLEGLEAVRKRPGMYIGSTGTRGLHHLIWEILDNGIDEHLAGFCDQIEITLQKDGGISIAYLGRGVPVDIHPIKKNSNCKSSLYHTPCWWQVWQFRIQSIRRPSWCRCLCCKCTFNPYDS